MTSTSGEIIRHAEHPHRLVAIMFTDIAGYSRLMGADEARALRILDRHDTILGSQIAAYGGEILKKMGDSIFASFDSATSAVRCAIAIQQDLAAYNRDCDDAERFAVRIGLHLGDVIERNGDLFGDGINVAARLQPLARPGGICISSAVYQAVLKSVEPKPVLVGEMELKNILERHVIYEFPPLYDVQSPESGDATQPASIDHRRLPSTVRVDRLPPSTSVSLHMWQWILISLGSLVTGMLISLIWLPAEGYQPVRGLEDVIRVLGAMSSFLWILLTTTAAIFIAAMGFVGYRLRPVSRRYVFRDIRGVDEWLEWAVMELGWCAPSKRGKALQFSPTFTTALVWGRMKLSVWVDGNSITVNGPSLFVDRLTRVVKATWAH